MEPLPKRRVMALAPPVKRAGSLYSLFQMRGANLYRTYNTKENIHLVVSVDASRCFVASLMAVIYISPSFLGHSV